MTMKKAAMRIIKMKKKEMRMRKKRKDHQGS